MKLMKYFTLILFVLMLLNSPTTKAEDATDKMKPYHHLENGFRNPEGAPERGSSFGNRFSFFAKAVWGSIAGDVPPMDTTHYVPQAEASAMFNKLYATNNSDNADMISWIGHATFFLRLDGVNILTDPVFARRASPVAFAGPARFLPPAPSLDELPQIDIIIVSHAHYDHLDTQTLDKIAGREKITAIVPLGLGHYFTARGFGAVHEVDWYDTLTFPLMGNSGFKFTAYPAVHWSNRTPFDVDETLWMSYAFSAGGKTIFHSGDTESYDKVFKEIGAHMRENYGRCDIGLMSAGAYRPRVMMRGVHTTPEGAVKIGEQVGCERMIPMHWGTFRLSLEPFFEPRDRFVAAAGNKAFVMRVGESVALANF